MAMIDQVVDRHFHAGESVLADPSLIITNLDTGIYLVGKMVTNLRDQVVFGSPGQSVCDPEEVGAALEALIAYLGQVGAMVDQLQACDRANRLTVAASAA